VANDCCARKGDTIAELGQRADQRRVLLIVMLINLAMFAAEFGFGVIARSSAMMADSVDMLGDAIVYALSLYAMTRGPRWEAGAAITKAGIILAFAIGIFVETMFKIAAGVTPSSRIMLSVTMIALIANLACLVLLWRFRNLNVNMSSTFECSQNDVLANVGVIVAGLLVAWTGAAWPDILVGFIIAVLFVRSAFRVLRSGWPVWRGHAGHVQFE